MSRRFAYIPLNTFPEPPADAAVRAALQFASSLGCGAHVAVFAARIPPVVSPLGGWLLDVPEMARAAEERSRSECSRLVSLVQEIAAGAPDVHSLVTEVPLGGVADTVATEARYFDLSLLPWTDGADLAGNMAEAILFGSGRPVVLVPDGPAIAPAHAAVAWDETRVAARALGDALSLLPQTAGFSVLTVLDEKPGAGSGIAQTLSASLELRGRSARSVEVALGGRTVAAALQDAAIAEGAGLLVMGGYGHSRLREFVLGGATRGVLAGPRLPVLMSH